MKNQPIMVINDVRYVERKPSDKRKTDCEQCAFAFDLVGCHAAVMGEAQLTFGGDCEARDVIYGFAEGRAAA